MNNEALLAKIEELTARRDRRTTKERRRAGATA